MRSAPGARGEFTGASAGMRDGPRRGVVPAQGGHGEKLSAFHLCVHAKLFFTFSGVNLTFCGFMVDFSDMNIWGVFAMPLGLVLCFGPALVVWIMMESKDSSCEAPRRDRRA